MWFETIFFQFFGSFQRTRRGGNIDISESVDPAGLEPAAFCVPRKRSSQLSYGPGLLLFRL